MRPPRAKVVLTCAVTGNLTTPEQTPYLPITPEEIAEIGAARRRGGGRDRASARARS